MKKIALILSLLNKREKKHLVFVLLAIIFMGFIELAGVGSISPFISLITDPDIIQTNAYLNKAYVYFGFSSFRDFILAFGTAVIVILALSNISLAFISFVINFYSGRRCHSIAMRLYEKYLCQPYLFFLNVNTADLSKNILNDVQTYIHSILVVFLQLISNAVSALFIILLLVIINPLVALCISFVLALSYLVIFSFIRNYLHRKGRERDGYNFLKYKYINESFAGIKEIKILNKEDVFLNLFAEPSKKFAMSDAKSDTISELPKYLLETIAFGGILGTILVLFRSGLVMENYLPLMGIYIFGAYRLLPALQKIFKGMSNIRYYFQIVNNLNKDLNILPDGESLSGGNIARLPFSKSICLENIVFRYPNTSHDIINKQSLKIASNSSVALVGPTGCGKTTFIDIILGLLEPQGGKIVIDNAEVNNKNRRGWQKNIGYVPQSIFLTDDTIRNNIAFGIAPDMIDDDALIRAAKLANIHDFVVNELEKGYDTIVGERGIRLSGGQKQRIGIARAVYHDPAVLILDEATSALDSITENVIIDAINNLNHKKTIVMIAHRLTTVKNCDIIYLMENGVIVDAGNYDELYNKNGAFKKMADGT
jgi:ABC-type multidrug transport system fused ATPase/permease subunit